MRQITIFLCKLNLDGDFCLFNTPPNMNWVIISSLEWILVDDYCSESPGTWLQTIFRTIVVVKKKVFFVFVLFIKKFYEFISVHLSQIDDMLERKILNAPRRFFVFHGFLWTSCIRIPLGAWQICKFLASTESLIQ